MTLLEQIINGNAHGATSLVEKALDRKLASVLKDERIRVMREAYGPSLNLEYQNPYRRSRGDFIRTQDPDVVAAKKVEYQQKLKDARAAHDAETDPAKKRRHKQDVEMLGRSLNRIKGQQKRMATKAAEHPDVDRKKNLLGRKKEAEDRNMGELINANRTLRNSVNTLSMAKQLLKQVLKTGHAVTSGGGSFSKSELERRIASREHAITRLRYKIVAMSKGKTGHLPEQETVDEAMGVGLHAPEGQKPKAGRQNFGQKRQTIQQRIVKLNAKLKTLQDQARTPSGKENPSVPMNIKIVRQKIQLAQTELSALNTKQS